MPHLINGGGRAVAVEKRLSTICETGGQDAFKGNEDFRKRVDLILSSGRQLLVLEFMRPGITIDSDHLHKFGTYIDILQDHIEANTALELHSISGYIVADNLVRKPGLKTALKNMRQNDRYAMDWETLIEQAKKQWKEFLDHVKQRAPEDQRLKAVGEKTP